MKAGHAKANKFGRATAASPLVWRKENSGAGREEAPSDDLWKYLGCCGLSEHEAGEVLSTWESTA